jgi:hypothetical protein
MDETTARTARTTQVPVTPPTQTKPGIERRRLKPFGSYRPADKQTTEPNYTTISPLEFELAEITKSWRTYRSTNDRDAVYIYLSRVFAVVNRWRRLSCAQEKSRAALRLQPNPPQMKPEPFSVVIFCTADPKIVDAKIRSKWSRVLRYARRAKPVGQSLAEFIKLNGGINECARKFAQPTE